MVIAEFNEIILGFGVLKLKGSLHPKLSDLYVNKNYRGNGVGSDLIKYREKIARDLAYSEMFVSVDPIENPKMIHLISKHGYRLFQSHIQKQLFFIMKMVQPIIKHILELI